MLYNYGVLKCFDIFFNISSLVTMVTSPWAVAKTLDKELNSKEIRGNWSELLCV